MTQFVYQCLAVLNLPLNDNTLRQACIISGDESMFCTFLGGIEGALLDIEQQANNNLSCFPTLDMSSTTAKVQLLTRRRIEYYKNFPSCRDFVRRLIDFYKSADNILFGTNIIYRAVDSIWANAGDTSTDLNFYTKRGLLGAVYCSSLYHFAYDYSDDFEDTWHFLSNRINNAVTLGKLKNIIGKCIFGA